MVVEDPSADELMMEDYLKLLPELWDERTELAALKFDEDCLRPVSIGVCQNVCMMICCVCTGHHECTDVCTR